MTQQSGQVPRCPICDGEGIFGYRNKATGELTWYCAAHRLGQFWADARRGPARSPTDPDWEGWEERETQGGAS
jgi:hypothetical protein